MKIIKSISLIILAFLITSCSNNSGMKPEDFKNKEPRLIIEEYLTGNVKAWGVLQNRSGKVTRQFKAAIRNMAIPRIAKNVGRTPHMMMIQAADWADWNGSNRSVSIVICITIGIKNGLSIASPVFDLPSRVNRSTMSTPDVGSNTGRFVQTLNDPKETGQRDKRVKRKNPATVRIEITNVTPADRRAASTIVSLTSRGSVRIINRIGEYGKSNPCPMIVPIAINIVFALSAWCASRNSVLTHIIAIKALSYLILV